MPLFLIAEHLTEPGCEGRRLLSGIKMRDIPYAEGAEGSDALLALFRYDLCH